MGMIIEEAAHVPIVLSGFVGRRRDLEELGGLIGSDRLITITGTGGIGKTRLALEVAGNAERDDSTRPVWVVELARLEDATLVATAVAEGVRAQTVRGVDPIERAGRTLGAERHILVLDNCEHVLAAAADAARYLLMHCPSLVVLATSREPLQVEGEKVYRVQTLGLPEEGASDVAAVLETESAQLFCDRARRVAPAMQLSGGNLAAVASICSRLDGLPLALELAAAWVSVLSLTQIAARLDADSSLLRTRSGNRPPRHRTMHAALEWSYQLVDQLQKTALARLSVFVGGFTIEGAESVLNGLSLESSALELIAALADHSLLVADTVGQEARYRLLEPIRHFAAEKLSLRPEEEREARLRHLRYLVDLAEAAEEHMLSGPDLPWLRRLDDELPNIRIALRWGFDNDVGDAARLCAALIWFCYIRSLYAEGLSWADRAMVGEGRLRARVAHMAGTLAGQAGDTQTADTYLTEARDLMEACGWSVGLVMVIFDQATLAYHRGDFEAMRRYGDEATSLASELGDEARIMQTLWTPAMLAEIDGDREKARDIWTEAIAIARRRDASFSGWMFSASLSSCLVDMGDQVAALRVLGECLASSSDFGDSPITNAYVIENVGILAVQRGDTAGGLRLMAAARAVFDRWHYRETPNEAIRRAQWIDTARESLSPAERDAAWQSGVELNLSETIADARGAMEAQVDPQRPSVGYMPGKPQSGSPGDDGSGSNEFIREGDFWSAKYGGRVVRVRDTKGVRDIARLLAAPRRRFAAVDLLGNQGRRVSRGVAAIKELGLTLEGDVGEALDAAARAQYRARLSDLEDEINEAEANNDPERTSRAREEREFILAELGAAVGLGGRARRVLDPAERARKAVTGRIRDAISHIEAAHPPLGRHLRRSVRTGSFCVYDPPEPTDWLL
jgi:predicted ATPase